MVAIFCCFSACRLITSLAQQIYGSISLSLSGLILVLVPKLYFIKMQFELIDGKVPVFIAF